MLGFKEIRYHEAGQDLPQFLEFLKQSFPDPRFVFLTRNLDEVTKSGWWAKRDATQVRQSLLNAEAAFRDFAKANEAVSFSLTFEEITRKDVRLRQLFEFLGASFDSAAVDDVLSERLLHAHRKG